MQKRWWSAAVVLGCVAAMSEHAGIEEHQKREVAEKHAAMKAAAAEVAASMAYQVAVEPAMQRSPP